MATVTIPEAIPASAAAPVAAKPPNAEEDKWYEPSRYTKTVTTVVTKSCLTSKVFFGIWLVITIMGAIALVFVSPMYALGHILTGVGIAFLALMNYDMACKLGYERFMQIALGFVLIGIVVMAVTTGTLQNANTAQLLTPAMVASKTIQQAHRVRMAAAAATGKV